MEHFKFGEVLEKNPKAIAEGVKKAMKNYNKCLKGLSAYRKDANWTTVAKRHMEIYSKLKK